MAGPSVEHGTYCGENNVCCSSRTSSRKMVGRGQLVDRRLPLVKAHTGEYSVTEHPNIKIQQQQRKNRSDYNTFLSNMISTWISHLK